MQIPFFVLSIIILLVGAPIVYLIGRFSARIFGFHRELNLSKVLGLIVILAAWIPLILAVLEIRLNESVTSYQFNGIRLTFDPISALASVITLFLGSAAVMFSGPYLAGESGEEKYYALFLLMSASILGLGTATDLFNLWVWFELMAISTYTLVAFYRNQSDALEAGVKYMVQSAVGSVFVLLGIALIFGQLGTLDLGEIKELASSSLPLKAAGALFLIGFGVKTAVVPLHTWLPDAHSQAPSGISAMLSGIVIEAGLIAMLRALTPLQTASTLWGPVILVLGVVNMLVGNLMALQQQQVKRMLAYSSISHVGYILAGIGTAILLGSETAAVGGLFHMLTHAAMKGTAFLTAGAFLFAISIQNQKHDVLELDHLNGAAQRYPFEAFAMSVSCLALGGLPLFAGFMSKWQIFTALFQTGSGWLIAVAIIMALNSVLSLGYYAPLVSRMYRLKPSTMIENGKPNPLPITLPIAVLSIIVILLGLYPPLVNWLTSGAGKALVGLVGN